MYASFCFSYPLSHSYYLTSLVNAPRSLQTNGTAAPAEIGIDSLVDDMPVVLLGTDTNARSGGASQSTHELARYSASATAPLAAVGEGGGGQGRKKKSNLVAQTSGALATVRC